MPVAHTPYFIKRAERLLPAAEHGQARPLHHLKDPRGLELMQKLVDTADVFVENYRPGALEHSGSVTERRERNQRLVYCSFGVRPYRTRFAAPASA